MGGAAVRWPGRSRPVIVLSGDLAWTCEVCGKWRRDEHIGVASFEVGVWRRNVRYCRDNEVCRDAAGERARKDAERLGVVAAR